MSAEPKAIGAASGLYGFMQMVFGALCTIAVSVWHDDSLLPTAVVLLVSAAAASSFFSFGSALATVGVGPEPSAQSPSSTRRICEPMCRTVVAPLVVAIVT